MTPEQTRHRRWTNYVLATQERAAGVVEVKSLPTSIMIPTGEQCNLRCAMCVDRSDPRRFRDLSFEEFLSLVPPIDHASTVAIYGWGEPLINPDYPRIFDHVCERCPGVVLHISTNGILLNKFWRNKFLNTKNLFLNISINAASPENYHHLMGKDRFHRVIRNIQNLLQERSEFSSDFPIVTISFVMQAGNLDEIPAFYELGRDLGVDEVLISDLMQLEEAHRSMAVAPLAGKALEKFSEAKELEEVGAGPSLKQFSDIPYLPPERENFCSDPWESLKIANNGDVSICCYAGRSFGNIFKQSMQEIWNSEDVKYYRATVNSPNPPPPCRSCPKKQGLFGIRETSEDSPAQGGICYELV